MDTSGRSGNTILTGKSEVSLIEVNHANSQVLTNVPWSHEVSTHRKPAAILATLLDILSYLKEKVEKRESEDYTVFSTELMVWN